MPHGLRSSHGPVAAIAFGPEMPGWGSWEWVGADLAAALGNRAVTFRAWEEPNAAAVVIVKHAPPLEWAERVSRRRALIYCPIDNYGSAEEIDSAAGFLRLCRHIIVHCKRLAPLLRRHAPTSYLDHHIKYAVPLGE